MLVLLSSIVIFGILGIENIEGVPIVELPQGKIAGHILKSAEDKNFYAFQEIPYAAPPVGLNRFKEPQEPIHWEHVLDASRNTKVCMQVSTSFPNMNITEDCLYLNVYTPVKPTVGDHTLPVLLWIHGGEFKFGSGILDQYDPRFLMDYDIVVVTINYRLGVLGFLSTTDNTIPANLAIKDQLKAIKWVSRNIHLFGGDNEKITVMGTSSGAMTSGYINLSKQSKGLLKGLILTSGSAISPCSYQDKPDYFAFKLGKALDENFNSNNSQDLLKLLQKSSGAEIVSATVIDDIYNNIVSPNLIWIPTVESQNDNNALVTKPMLEAISNGNFDRIPMMFGFDSGEGLSFVHDLETIENEAKRIDFDPSLLISPRLHVPPEELPLAGEEYRSVYTQTKFQYNISTFVKYMGDELFLIPTLHHAVLASAYTPAYFYQFSYEGLMGERHVNNIPGINGPGHGDELNYIFNSKQEKVDHMQFPKEDQLTKKRMLTLITNFVKYQNPTPSVDNLLQGIVWPQIKENSLQYLNINNTLEVREIGRAHV